MIHDAAGSDASRITTRRDRAVDDPPRGGDRAVVGPHAEGGPRHHPCDARHGPFMGSCHRRGIIGVMIGAWGHDAMIRRPSIPTTVQKSTGCSIRGAVQQGWASAHPPSWIIDHPIPAASWIIDRPIPAASWIIHRRSPPRRVPPRADRQRPCGPYGGPYGRLTSCVATTNHAPGLHTPAPPRDSVAYRTPNSARVVVSRDPTGRSASGVCRPVILSFTAGRQAFRVGGGGAL